MRQNINRLNALAGIVLVLLGVLFLVSQIFEIQVSRYLWPLVVMAFGALFFVGYFTSGKEGALLAVPGSVIFLIGMILLVMNLTGIWQTWAYAWTLMIAAAGFGLILSSRRLGSKDMSRTGGFLIRLGLILFIVFGAFFEGLINLSGWNIRWSIVWPAALVLAGLYLLISQLLVRRR
jgi:hypothetical protein